MSSVAAIGEPLRLEGFVLAGVRVLAADSPDAVRSAWSSLDEDVGLVLLTPAAARTLGDLHAGHPRVLVAVLP